MRALSSSQDDAGKARVWPIDTEPNEPPFLIKRNRSVFELGRSCMFKQSAPGWVSWPHLDSALNMPAWEGLQGSQVDVYNFGNKTDQQQARDIFCLHISGAWVLTFDTQIWSHRPVPCLARPVPSSFLRCRWFPFPQKARPGRQEVESRLWEPEIQVWIPASLPRNCRTASKLLNLSFLIWKIGIIQCLLHRKWFVSVDRFQEVFTWVLAVCGPPI